MENKLELKIAKEAIKVFKENLLTPKELLKNYKIALDTLQVMTPLFKDIFEHQKKIEKVLFEQTQEIEKLQSKKQ